MYSYVWSHLWHVLSLDLFDFELTPHSVCGSFLNSKDTC